MATPRFAWGIDVGNRALKAIRLVRDGEQIRIDDFEVIEHEQILSQAGDNRETLIQTALQTFAQKHPVKGGAVAIGVSGQASFARFIKLPPVDPGKIPEIVKFEAIQQIPFPLEDVEWSYQLFQTPDSPEVEVGIFAMRRELVNQIIGYFTEVGLQVTAVQMNPLAVYNGLYYDDQIKETTMIVDVGAENSDLIIAEPNSVWMRSIPIGGNNFTESLVGSFKLKFPKAEELKRNAATSKYGRQILQAMKPVFSDLVGEIQRSIGFYSSTHRDSRISKVLALGGTFRLPGLQKYLQQNLQLDVTRIERLGAPTPAEARFASTFNENILSAVAAYGLALQAMGQGTIVSSLLPEKIRRERMWKEKTWWFAAAAAMFVAGTSIAVGRLYADRFAYDGLDQKTARDNITAAKAKYAKADAAWAQDIEKSGKDDRTAITNYTSLLADRDLQIKIANEIGNAFPPSPSEDVLKRQPRTDRQVVELVGWTMRYEPDMSGLLKIPDDDFNQHADKTAENSGNGAGAPPSMSAQPSTPQLGGGGAQGQPSAAQRGFLLTIQCRTPNADPTKLISQTIVRALKARNQSANPAPVGYSIERVTIPTKVKVATAFPSGTVKAKKPPLVFTPPPPPGADPNAAPAQPQNTQLTPIAPPDPFADPAFPGESTREDSFVTVLAAIVIDPPPKVAPLDPNAPLQRPK